jgi:hypothetical protein
VRNLIVFWSKYKFRLVLALFLILLLYLVYGWFFGRDIKMSNPAFSTISNFDSIECSPLARGGSSVWNSVERQFTGAWARDSRNESDKKWLTKWVAVRNGKIYFGTFTGAADGKDYINFDQVFDMVDQKNETKLLGSQVNVITPPSYPQNVKFTILLLDKTKGILSISVNESSWFGDESVGGYNEVYTCREVRQDILSGSRGLPEVDLYSQAISKLDQITEIDKIKQKVFQAGRKPFYTNEGIRDKIVSISLRESFPEDAHTTRIDTFNVGLDSGVIMVEDVVSGGQISLEDWKLKTNQSWGF